MPVSPKGAVDLRFHAALTWLDLTEPHGRPPSHQRPGAFHPKTKTPRLKKFFSDPNRTPRGCTLVLGTLAACAWHHCRDARRKSRGSRKASRVDHYRRRAKSKPPWPHRLSKAERGPKILRQSGIVILSRLTV